MFARTTFALRFFGSLFHGGTPARREFFLLCLLLPVLAAMARGGEESKNYFGSSLKKEGALIGIFYDLKQTQKFQPTGISTRDYDRIVADFLNKGWPEEDLAKYFRATRPMYADRIFVPLILASEVPGIFEVEKIVKGQLWLVHYKGQVKPPKAGTYRFVGFCDDFIAVAINGKNLFVSHWPGDNFPGVNWKSPEPIGPKCVHGKLMYGDWFDLQNDEIVDLDIAMGEIPGGGFGAWLYYQEKGVNYKSDPDGFPLLPVFQVEDAPMPPLPEGPFGKIPKKYPPFATGYPNWKSVQ